MGWGQGTACWLVFRGSQVSVLRPACLQQLSLQAFCLCTAPKSAPRCPPCSELHILDDSLTLYHFMVAPEGAAAAAAAAAAAGGEAAAAAAGEAVAAAPGPVADLLLPQLAQGPAAAGPPLQPVPNLFPAMPLFDQDVFGGGLGGIPMEADAAAGWDPALAGQLPWELGEPPLAAGGQPAQQQQQQQQQQPEAGAGGLGPQGRPGGGREAGPAAGHAQSEGHFRMLTVGGEQPVAGGPQFPGKALVVQGRAAITGPLEVQGVEVVSGEVAALHARGALA